MSPSDLGLLVWIAVGWGLAARRSVTRRRLQRGKAEAAGRDLQALVDALHPKPALLALAEGVFVLVVSGLLGPMMLAAWVRGETGEHAPATRRASARRRDGATVDNRLCEPAPGPRPVCDLASNPHRPSE